MQEKTFSSTIDNRHALEAASTFDVTVSSAIRGLTGTARQHWPEYLMEAAGMMIFVITTCSLGALLFYPTSPVAQMIHQDGLRRLAFGTAIAFPVIAFI